MRAAMRDAEERGVAEQDNAAAGGEAGSGPAAEDRARAQLYLLLARLLREAPSEDFLREVKDLPGGDGAIGAALAGLANAAGGTDRDALARAYHDLFIGVGEGELIPYASYYRTGFLNERPLARLRQDMARLGLARHPACKEPEDWIVSLCEIMAGLILGRFGPPASLADQQGFFDAHLAPWAERFFLDLHESQPAAFYRAVGALGQAFMKIEARCLDMAA